MLKPYVSEEARSGVEEVALKVYLAAGNLSPWSIGSPFSVFLPCRYKAAQVAASARVAMAGIVVDVDPEKSVPSGKPEETAAVPPESVAGAADKDSRLRPQTVSSTIDFLVTVGKLKSTKRQGWLIQRLENTESVADHMYRMAIMTLIAPQMPGLDQSKCVAMALVHDIAEAHVGDITPHCGKSKQEKHALEDDAITRMCSELGAGPGAELVRALWDEYEAGATLEAKFLKDVDKIELLLQTAEYEGLHNKRMSEFFDQTAGKFQTPLGVAWAAEVVSRRPPLP